MSGGGFRVSIPGNVKKTIQNIKEITGHHSDEEIYAMLKECSMDPNETTQRLLLQDPFHEVKRRRDKRKENSNNKESAESRWRSGTQGRGSRAGRGTFPPRNAGHDAGGTKNSGLSKDNVTNPVSEKAAGQSSIAQDTKNKEPNLAVSSASVMANGPANESGISSIPAKSGINHAETGASSDADNKKVSTVKLGIGNTQEHATGGSSLIDPAPSSAVCLSSSDSVVVASNASTLPCVGGMDKVVAGSHESYNEATINSTKLTAGGSEVSGSSVQVKMPNRTQGVLKNPLNDSLQSSEASTHVGSSVSRPSSNYSSRSQQTIGPSRVGSNKEWKPKPVSSSVGQGSGIVALEVPSITVEARDLPNSASDAVDSEEATSKLPKKLEDLHLPQRQHVIIPNHIHVPESERNKLSFGSFDASFGLTTTYTRVLGRDKSSTLVLESSQDLEETVEESMTSNPNAPDLAEDRDYGNHLSSPTHEPENVSAQGDVSISAAPDYKETKQEYTSTSGGRQYSVVHTPPNYNFGFVPPMLGSQLATFENSESQARDASRIPSFIVQQPFDPANYYAQFYRSASDNDGRISPFASSGVASKYNGNLAGLPSQTSQSQEGGNSLVLSSTGPSPLVTQAAGLMQSSIALSQQSVPVFRPPAGMHISHYPPNFIPYGHYFFPFYVPSPTIHHYLSNGAFPQQPQAGSVYSSPQAAGTGVKFSLPQYKPGTNTVTSTHIPIPSGYGAYSSPPAGYNVSSTMTAGNSTTNEDLAASQFKDSNVYFTGQQSEGSGVWIAAPGREMSSLPESFYNLPPQGQHVTFSTTQAVPGSFTSIYHPAQVVSSTVHPLLQQSQAMAGGVDMVGPATNVYQQPQHTQVNWPSNY